MNVLTRVSHGLDRAARFANNPSRYLVERPLTSISYGAINHLPNFMQGPLMSLASQTISDVNSVSAPVLKAVSHGLMIAPTTTALADAARRLDNTFFFATNSSTYESMAEQGMWNFVNMFSHRHAQVI